MNCQLMLRISGIATDLAKRRQRDGCGPCVTSVIKTFNEASLQIGRLRPKQRVRFINIANHVMNHADRYTQVKGNPDIRKSPADLRGIQ